MGFSETFIAYYLVALLLVQCQLQIYHLCDQHLQSHFIIKFNKHLFSDNEYKILFPFTIENIQIFPNIKFE